MLMNTWQFHLWNKQGVGPMWTISISFLFTVNHLSEHSHSHTGLILLIVWNLHCYLHFAFCLFVWLIKLKCLSSISPLGLFQGIIHNIEGLKGGTLKSWITGVTCTKRGNSDPSSYPDLFFSCLLRYVHTIITFLNE